VLVTAVVLTIIVTIAFLLVFWLLSWLSTRANPLAAEQPKGAAVKYDPKWNIPPQLEQLRLLEAQFFSTYKWVDQAQGVARVPVDRAIKLMAEKGLPPVIGTTGPASSEPPQQTVPSDAAPPPEPGDE
jgi:hypothetical protein